MKKRKILSAVLAAALTFSAVGVSASAVKAETEPVEDDNGNILYEWGNLYFASYTGPDDESGLGAQVVLPVDEHNEITELVIPESVNDNAVIEFFFYGLEAYTSLTSITIPASVTTFRVYSGGYSSDGLNIASVHYEGTKEQWENIYLVVQPVWYGKLGDKVFSSPSGFEETIPPFEFVTSASEYLFGDTTIYFSDGSSAKASELVEGANTSGGTSDPSTDQSVPTIPPVFPSDDKSETSDSEASEPTESDTATTEPTVFEPVIDNAESLDEETKEILSGITVTDENGAFEDGVVMNIKPADKNGSLFSFDITFTKDGKEVQPSGPVTVKVPIPEYLKGKKIYVYHYNELGKLVAVPSTVEDGFVIFEATHFSVYVLSNELIEDEAPDDTSSDETPATDTDDLSAPSLGDTNNGSNPSTGIGYAFVPVLLAAGAVAVSISKKRK